MEEVAEQLLISIKQEVCLILRVINGIREGVINGSEEASQL